MERTLPMVSGVVPQSLHSCDTSLRRILAYYIAFLIIALSIQYEILYLFGYKDRPSSNEPGRKSASPLNSSHIVLCIVSHAHGKAFIQKAAKLFGPGAFKFGCLYTAAHHAWSLLGRLMSHVSTFFCLSTHSLYFPFFYLLLLLFFNGVQ